MWRIAQTSQLAVKYKSVEHISARLETFPTALYVGAHFCGGTPM
jgi:hypothetical protein